MRLQGFQQSMDSHKRENFPHTSKHQHITAFVRLILDFINKLSFANDSMKLLQEKNTSIFRLHIWNCIYNIHILADRKEGLVQVADFQPAG